jgi:hypothetical protein
MQVLHSYPLSFKAFPPDLFAVRGVSHASATAPGRGTPSSTSSRSGGGVGTHKKAATKKPKPPAVVFDVRVENNFFCAQCDKHFTLKKNLSRHMLIHDPKAKKYACTW